MFFARQIKSFFLFAAISCFSTPGFTLLNNNVRTDRFDWQVTETEHFIIHYDKESENLVPQMGQYLEDAWVEVGERVDYQVPGKTPFFFYSNHNQFEQTNIVRIGEGTGGVTEAFKNRFVIFNDGSDQWMKHVIFHEFGHVVQFNVLYGGFWKSIRLLKSPFYPLWFMEGMAEYVSGDMDFPLGEMIIRDAVFHDTLAPLEELQGFNHLKPNQVTLAYKTGDMAMRFLADEYGPEKVGELLKKIEGYFDISSALEDLLGLKLARFDYRFREWLEDRFRLFYQEGREPSYYGPSLTESGPLPRFYSSPVLSPDGETLYYFSDQKGPTRLFSKNLKTQKVKQVLGRKWARFEHIHDRGRALDISPDGRWLVFAGEKKQFDFLYLYDLKKKKLKKKKMAVEQIRYPRFSPSGETVAFVGMERGYNDIYLYHIAEGSTTRLTENPQDEANPAFSPNGKTLYYSGEVFNEAGTQPMGRDIFKLNLKNKEIARVTFLRGDVNEPLPLPNGDLIVTRDVDDEGQTDFNLWLLDSEREKPQPLTNMIGGAFSPVWHVKENKLIYVAFVAGERQVYQLDRTEEGPFVIEPAPDERGLAQKEKAREKPRAEEALTWGPRKKGFSQLGIGHAKRSLESFSQDGSLLETSNPYKFRASTDLFLPFFFYSTQDGFVGADIWQFSDYLGNHQFQQLAQYGSKDDFVDLSLFYTYARFRPQLTFGFRNQRYFRDVNKLQLRRQTEGVAIVSYPLDRVNSVSVGVGATDRKDRFLDQAEPEIDDRERYWLVTLAHDTVTGRYLVPTQGRRLSLFYQDSVRNFNSNLDFKTGGAEAVQYIRLPRESAIASRIFYGRSIGEEPQVFRLGGVDRVRGVSRNSLENKKHNLVMGSVEARLRLTYLSARTRFLFPDFFFKGAYLILFDDVGYGWDTREEREAFKPRKASNSAGVGLSWPTFILQSFQLNLTVQWARRTDEGEDIWFISLGPTF